jgi:hypothetical protein
VNYGPVDCFTLRSVPCQTPIVVDPRDRLSTIERFAILCIRNEKPCLAVIKHNIRRSISPVPVGYAPGFAMGQEICYYLFPRTDVQEALSRRSRVFDIKRLDRGHLTVAIQMPNTTDILERIYCLDLDFQTVKLDFPDEFKSFHRQLELEKLVDHALPGSGKNKLWQLERLK